jgi:hypothetical protein
VCATGQPAFLHVSRTSGCPEVTVSSRRSPADRACNGHAIRGLVPPMVRIMDSGCGPATFAWCQRVTPCLGRRAFRLLRSAPRPGDIRHRVGVGKRPSDPGNEMVLIGPQLQVAGSPHIVLSYLF